MSISFEQIYIDYHDRMYRLAYSWLQNHAETEDAIQDSFIKVYQAIDTLLPGTNTYAWLYSIVRRTCIDYIRKRNVRLRICGPLNDALEKPQVDMLTDVEVMTDFERLFKRIGPHHASVLKLYLYAGNSRVDGAVISGDKKFPNKVRAAQVAAKQYRRLFA